MRCFLSFTFLLATLFTSRVFALEVAVGGTVGNVSATDFLNISNSSVVATCGSQCQPAKNALGNCTTDTCFCNTTTIQDVATCEQCMFYALISGDLEMTDPREGSQTALTAYGTACGAALNTTIDATLTTLTLPSDWDGPFGQALSPVATAFVVIIAVGLGSSSIWIICNM